MKRRTIVPIITLLSLSVASTGANAQQASTAAARAIGVWAGALDAGAYRLRLQMTIRRDSAGALAGVMKSIDQGGVEVPAMVQARSDTVSFSIPDQGITYRGVMNAAGDSIRGTFQQGQALPLTLVRSIATEPTRRPQAPTTGMPTEYASIEETIAPRVLELIVSWINQRSGAR